LGIRVPPGVPEEPLYCKGFSYSGCSDVCPPRGGPLESAVPVVNTAFGCPWVLRSLGTVIGFEHALWRWEEASGRGGISGVGPRAIRGVDRYARSSTRRPSLCPLITTTLPPKRSDFQDYAKAISRIGGVLAKERVQNGVVRKLVTVTRMAAEVYWDGSSQQKWVRNDAQRC